MEGHPYIIIIIYLPWPRYILPQTHLQYVHFAVRKLTRQFEIHTFVIIIFTASETHVQFLFLFFLIARSFFSQHFTLPRSGLNFPAKGNDIFHRRRDFDGLY